MPATSSLFQVSYLISDEEIELIEDGTELSTEDGTELSTEDSKLILVSVDSLVKVVPFDIFDLPSLHPVISNAIVNKSNVFVFILRLS